MILQLYGLSAQYTTVITIAQQNNLIVKTTEPLLLMHTQITE